MTAKGGPHTRQAAVFASADEADKKWKQEVTATGSCCMDALCRRAISHAQRPHSRIPYSRGGRRRPRRGLTLVVTTNISQHCDRRRLPQSAWIQWWSGSRIHAAWRTRAATIWRIRGIVGIEVFKALNAHHPCIRVDASAYLQVGKKHTRSGSNAHLRKRSFATVILFLSK